MTNQVIFFVEMTTIASLFEACREGNMHKLVKLTKNYNSSFYFLDSERNSLVHCAAKHGHLEILKYLMKKGSFDRSVFYERNSNLHTPLDLAIHADHGSIFEYVLKQHDMLCAIEFGYLHLAFDHGAVNVLEAIHKWHPDSARIFSAEKEMHIYLSDAIEQEQRKVIRFLAFAFPGFKDYLYCRLERQSITHSFVKLLDLFHELHPNILKHHLIVHAALKLGVTSPLKYLKRNMPDFQKCLENRDWSGMRPLEVAYENFNCRHLILWLIENHRTCYGFFEGKIPETIIAHLEKNHKESFEKLKLRLRQKCLQRELEDTLVYSEIPSGLCHEVLNVVMQNTELLICKSVFCN